MSASPSLQLLLATAGGLSVACALAWAGEPDWPSCSAAEIPRWYEGVGPARAAATVLRGGAAAGCAWLAVAASLQLVASIRPRGGLRTLADRVSPAMLRRLAGTAVAASMSIAVAGPVAAGDGVGSPGTAVMVVIDGPPLAPAAMPVPVPAIPGAPASVAPSSGPVEVRVAVGDSFWRLAERAVEQAHGPRVDDAAVADYWRRVLAANRERLVDPGNADLLLPGQVVVLPVVV